MNRFNQRGLIDNFSARSVDEVSVFFHRAEEFRINQQLRVRLQSDWSADDISHARDIERRLLSLDTKRFSLFRSKTSAPGNHIHAERFGMRNHLLTNSPDTHQAERAAKQTARLGKLFL